MTAREILLQTRALIQKHGWCRHLDQSPPAGRLPINGALLLAIGTDGIEQVDWPTDPEHRVQARRACAVLEEVVGTTDVGRWNDAPERTINDIFSALDAAADRCSP